MKTPNMDLKNKGSLVDLCKWPVCDCC